MNGVDINNIILIVILDNGRFARIGDGDIDLCIKKKVQNDEYH
jgi:hypothetical protein